MNAPIATSEDTVRPSLGRPTDNPSDPPKKRIVIHYKHNGIVWKTRIREALCKALEESKDRLEQATGKDYSQTIIVRRALDLYLYQLAKMTEDQLILEAYRLGRHR